MITTKSFSYTWRSFCSWLLPLRRPSYVTLVASSKPLVKFRPLLLCPISLPVRSLLLTPPRTSRSNVILVATLIAVHWFWTPFLMMVLSSISVARISEWWPLGLNYRSYFGLDTYHFPLLKYQHILSTNLFDLFVLEFYTFASPGLNYLHCSVIFFLNYHWSLFGIQLHCFCLMHTSHFP